MIRRVTRHSSPSEEHGSALVELCIIVPIVVMLGFIAIEFTRILRIQQALGVIAREVAHETFRLCTPGQTGSDLGAQACITEVRARAENQLRYVISGLRLYVTLYEVTGTPKKARLSAQTKTTNIAPEPASRFTIDAAGYSNDPRINTLTDLDTIAVAEVYFTYTPALPPYLQTLLVQAVDFYDSAIY